MSMIKVGRNDPCPCGSGKKYKRCHWDTDENQPRVAFSPEPSIADEVATFDFEGMRRQMQAVGGKGAGDDPNFTRLIEKIEVLANYQARHAEVEAAGEALEPHRAEFNALLKDEVAVMERARRVFAEERFAALRFHAADLQRAFEAVGYPGLAADRQTLETMRKAILFLGDAECRQELTARLLLALPDYVAAGRFLDAWLVQDNAFLMTEEPAESNPFLYVMFHHGLVEWDAQRRQNDFRLLSAMGVNMEQLRALPADEFESFMSRLFADPAKQEQLEALVASQPEMRALLEAECASADALSVSLLDRADAAHLLPSEEEIIPWLDQFQQRILADERFAGMLRGETPTGKAQTALGDLMWSLSTEMAGALFTAERVTQLKNQLREFAGQHRATGDLEGRAQAEAALLTFQRSAPTDKNHFLKSICWTALRNALRPREFEAPAA